MKAAFGLALFLGCLTGLLVADDSPDLEKLVSICLSENGVTSQDIADLKTGAVSPENVTDNLKCASQCIFAKSGFMDAQGNLLTENIQKHFNETGIVEILSTCKEIKGDNPCDTAFKIMGCLESKSRALLNQTKS